MTTQTEAQKLAEVFYCDADGSVFWKVKSKNGKSPAGTKAGYKTTCGGIKVMLQKRHIGRTTLFGCCITVICQPCL
jgi:hypothetical protein